MIKKQWKEHEDYIAKKFNGKLQKGSGNARSTRLKGDCKDSVFLHEAKSTEAESIVVKNSVFDKIKAEALRQDRIPVLDLDIAGQKYTVLSTDDFLHLLTPTVGAKTAEVADTPLPERMTARQKAKAKANGSIRSNFKPHGTK